MFKKFKHYIAVTILSFTLLAGGCSQIELASHYTKKVINPWSNKSMSKGQYKVGSPYTIAGKRYYPKEDFNLVQTGIASWYGPGFHGKQTANGEVYNQYAMTAAHKTLQLPAIARVTNLENGRSVIVRINDRGPYEKGRVIDMSKAAAKKLGMLRNGTARVRVQVLPRESIKVAEAAKRGHDTSKMQYRDNKPKHQNQISDRQRIRKNEQLAYNTKTKNYKTAYLKNDSTMDYVPMGKTRINELPESLHRPVITSKLVTQESKFKGKNVNSPEWEDMNYAIRPVSSFSTNAVDSSSTKVKKPSFISGSSPVSSNEKSVYVQAGAFSIYKNADRLGDKLSKIAPVHINEIHVKDRLFYRVRLGPVKTIEEAKIVEQNIRSIGYNDPMHIIVE